MFSDWLRHPECVLCHRIVLWILRFFFFAWLFLMLLEKSMWKYVQSGKCLRAFSLQEVWSKVWRCKLSWWCYRLHFVMCWCWMFFQAIEELKNFCQGLDRPLSGLGGSTGCPLGFSGAGQRAWVRKVGLWGELRVPGGGRSPEDAHLPLSCLSEERRKP